MKLTGLTSGGLPGLSTPKMPKIYKKKPLTIHGLLIHKVAQKASSGAFTQLNSISHHVPKIKF